MNKILLENKNLQLIDDENKNFYRINLKNKTDIQNLRGFAGIFFEKNLDNLKKISKYLYPKYKLLHIMAFLIMNFKNYILCFLLKIQLIELFQLVDL